MKSGESDEVLVETRRFFLVTRVTKDVGVFETEKFTILIEESPHKEAE